MTYGKLKAPLIAALAATLTACGLTDPWPSRTTADQAKALPRWSFSQDMVFPADRSLARPEDGVALADGRLVVADQVHGLRLVMPDGSSRPFGKLAAAGYMHKPPEVVGGANGVTLEPSGSHVLVSDVYRGGIYRVDLANEVTERVHQHPFGVNVARRDRRGAIWFTQSTRNPPESGEARLFGAVAKPIADGALYYLPPGGGSKAEASPVVDGLFFANGIALDERVGHLYVAELMANRVLRFRIDPATGALSDRTTVLEITTPDNLAFDPPSRLWVGSPVRNEIVVLDIESGIAHPVFRASTARSEQLVAEAERRLRSGQSIIELLGPALWEPASGMITGVILSPRGGPVYATGLGNALIRLPR